MVSIAILLSVVPASPALGQTVLVRTLQRDGSAPISGALVHLETLEGDVRHRQLSDALGRALFTQVRSGAYRARVEVIGFGTESSTAITVEDGRGASQVTVYLSQRPIELAGLDVAVGSGRCSTRPSTEGALLSQIWDEARKALSNAVLVDERETYRYATMRYRREIERESGLMLSEEEERREGYMRTPYESRPAADLVENGFVQDGGETDLFFAPDAGVMLSDEFLDSHCFHLVGRDPDNTRLVGLGFRPTGHDRSVPDISGVMWLHRGSAELRRLDFTYEYLEPERTAPEVGGQVQFEALPDGSWIVREWWIRMPVMSEQTDFTGRSLQFISSFRQTGGVVLEAVAAGGRSLGDFSRGGGVEGIVLDSLGLPVTGATVSITGSRQEIYTDGSGRFGITGLREGRYELLVAAGALNDVGYTYSALADVIPGEMSWLRAHLPSLSDVFADLCDDPDRPVDAVALAGRVRDARGRPVAGAVIRADWLEYNFSGVDSGRRASDLREVPNTTEVSSDSTGTYVICDIPATALVEVTAAAGGMQSEGAAWVTVPEGERGAVLMLSVRDPGSS